jgi:hypothetical protein
VSEAADIASIIIGAMAVIIAALALYVSRSTLEQQQTNLKQQTYLDLSARWNQAASMRRPINEWSEQDIYFMLDFFDLVGHLVSKGLLDKETVEHSWGMTIKSLPKFTQIEELVHDFRHTKGYHEAWKGVDSLIKDLGGSSHPFRKAGS